MKPKDEGVGSAVLGQPCLNVCPVLCLPASSLSPELVPIEFSEPRAWVVNTLEIGHRAPEDEDYDWQCCSPVSVPDRYQVSVLSRSTRDGDPPCGL